MAGKLIVLEATDGSGKATQTELLFARLQAEHRRVRRIEFPNYASEASALVRMYLRGDFGHDPQAISPYIASTFYAVDRYASFRTDWGAFHRDGGIVIADRYTTANMVHQAGKIDNEDERVRFVEWLRQLEYGIYGLPEPDCVIFLDMPPEYSHRLLVDRGGKDGAELDIHETDANHVAHAYRSARWVASRYGWQQVRCVSGDDIRSIEAIHDDVYRAVSAVLD
jgi:dTMP kinase